jgi:tRNA/tmRNA/rRNA uracil-C5-methylase (TrmA/RlmC/RlmD family)
MSQRLGGLELISPAVEDDIVMGPGIVDKVESAEIGDTLREPSITTAVLDSKRSQTKDTIIRESNSKELERQNKMMNQQLKSVTSVLKSINSKESNSYFDSEKVTRNIGRSTAGFR